MSVVMYFLPAKHLIIGSASLFRSISEFIKVYLVSNLASFSNLLPGADLVVMH